MVRPSRLVPGPLVRWFARPYVAGGSMAAGLETALALREEEGSGATMDLLGEAVHEDFHVLRHVAAYESLIDALGQDPRFADRATRPTVSVKPSAFTTGEPAAAGARLAALADRARARGVALTIDMEDRAWTDRTIRWAVDLFRHGHDVGTVLQTRLHRTEADLDRIPAGMRLRLVIGIYPEPAEFALQDKAAMKERMLTYARTLLERGVYVEFATHDEACLERFLRDVAPIAPDRCELQMLLGVPRRGFLRRHAAGELGVVLPVRRYVPFALSWDDATAYLRRRMDESPNLIGSVLTNLLKPAKR
ncbi:MAG: proline dehydrogenase family protein [Planctomycetota bacterium]